MLWRATGKGRSPQAAMNSRLNRWICRAYSRKLQRSTGVDSDPILRIGLAPGHCVRAVSTGYGWSIPGVLPGFVDHGEGIQQDGGWPRGPPKVSAEGKRGT